MSMFGYLLFGIGFILLIGVIRVIIKAGHSVAQAVLMSAKHLEAQATLNTIEGDIEIAHKVATISGGTTTNVYEYYRILQKELRKGTLPNTSPSKKTSTRKKASTSTGTNKKSSTSKPSTNRVNKSPDYKHVEC